MGKSMQKKLRGKINFKAKQKLTNPFELRHTKVKHVVVGRKLKHPVGKPGISRAKALDKRKASLLQEYKLKGKTNVFVDKRIGETDEHLSSEDRMLMRFTAERLRHQNNTRKKNIYLLPEENLTHGGKSIDEIESFQDVFHSDDGDDDGLERKKDKQLSADFVSETHFGGFLMKSDMEYARGESNTRKTWIDNMILDSKKRKAEKMATQEKAFVMTQDLDNLWKEISMNTAQNNKDDESNDGVCSVSTYATIKANMDIHTKQQPVKSAEPDSYDTLMLSLSQEFQKAKATDRLKTDEEIAREYVENMEKLQLDYESRMKEYKANQSKISVQIDNASTMGVEEEEKQDCDNQKDSETLDSKTLDCNIVNEIPYFFEVSSSYEEFCSLLDGFHDNPTGQASVVDRMIKCNHPLLSIENKGKLENIFIYLLHWINKMALYAVNLSIGSPTSFQSTDAITSIERVTPYLYDLATFFPCYSATNFLKFIMEKYEAFNDLQTNNENEYPSLDSLIFIKITFLLFPSSHYHHPVVTPVLHWISKILSSCTINSRNSISKGIYLCAILSDCIRISKRFSPELLNFLTGFIGRFVLATKQNIANEPSRILVPPFDTKSTFWNEVNQELLSSHRPLEKAVGLSFFETVQSLDDQGKAEFWVSALDSCLLLLNSVYQSWRHFHKFISIQNVLLAKDLESITTVVNQPFITERIRTLKNTLSILEINLQNGYNNAVTSGQPKQPLILKQYEPLFDESFDPSVSNRQRKGKTMSETREMQKLLHKVKRSTKAAKKEIRADSAFIAQQKSKEKRESDADRKRKTRLILGELGSQEGDYRKIMKTKSKLKSGQK